MDWEKRKKSEQWVAVMADKYVEDKSELTFAEWCYRQGQAEERQKFAKWLPKNLDFECDGCVAYAECFKTWGSISCCDRILEAYEKSQNEYLVTQSKEELTEEMRDKICSECETQKWNDELYGWKIDWRSCMSRCSKGVKASEKEVMLNYFEHPFLTNNLNKMNCDCNYYNPYFAISKAFKEKEVQKMTETEIKNLLHLANIISDGLIGD